MHSNICAVDVGSGLDFSFLFLFFALGLEVMAEDVRAASTHLEGQRERIPDCWTSPLCLVCKVYISNQL